MLKTTVWRPDTCNCVLEFQWDTEDPELNRVHTFLPPKEVCQVHSLVAPRIINEEVMRENRIKNVAISMLVEGTELNEGDISWSFRSDRTLGLAIKTPLSDQERARFTAAADIRFGPQKVIVV